MTERKLIVNPEPLKIVEARAGEERPVKRQYVICTLWTVNRPGVPQRMRRISVHVKGCAHIPFAHNNQPGTSDDVSKALAEADSHGAQQAISCRGCGGWTVA